MRKLSFIAVLLPVSLYLIFQKNPHGPDLKFDCSDCHTTEGWTFSGEKAIFTHEKTRFRLEGQHQYTGCRECHISLVFNEAGLNCVDCHTDLHQGTVGQDCARCHTSRSWLVHNITEIHHLSRFPLLGAHRTADCNDCHISASLQEYRPLGIDCYDCHMTDYQSATEPNHVQTGISTDCAGCHRVDAYEWRASGISHDFFPLTQGHQIADCSACHQSGIFVPLSSECYSCHRQDFQAASNPSHSPARFSTICTECHTTNPGWKPAKFDIHDAWFPIYSGSHKGEWNNCSDCHRVPENYSVFSCTDCHEHNKSEMDDKHRKVNGYAYNSNACLECHPQGKE